MEFLKHILIIIFFAIIGFFVSVCKIFDIIMWMYNHIDISIL